MIMIIIALTGNPRVGKDTCAVMLSKLFGCNIYSFASPLKQYIETAFGVDYDKFKQLQLSDCITGRDVVNAIAEFPKVRLPDYFADIVIDDIIHDDNEFAIISDLRFDVEYYAISALEFTGDTVIIVEVLNNSSELICRDKFPADYTITNISDLSALQECCNQLFRDITCLS